MKFKYKIFLGIFSITFIVSGATGSFFYLQAKNGILNAVKQELLALSQIGASFIKGDVLEKLVSPKDMNSSSYRHIQEILKKIENSNEEILYAYTMRLNKGKVEFIVDSPPSDDNHDGKITEDEMPYAIGEEYKNPPKSLLMGFVSPSTDKEPVHDEMGWTISGYCPIFNSQGKSVALMGVDMTAKRLQNKLLIIKKAGLVSLSISLILTILFSLYFSKIFLSPLKELKGAMKEVSRGNLAIELNRNTPDEVAEVFEGFNHMTRELREKSLLKSILGKVVDPKIIDELSKDEVTPGGKVIDAVVLFCDIQGFSQLCAKLPPTLIVSILNSYFSEMVEVIQKWDGYVDKFIGDGLLAVFNHPKKLKDPYKNAIAASLEMIQRCRKLNQKLVLKEYSLSNSIGLHEGKMVAGLMGSQDRMEYTVIGEVVNLTERLEKTNRQFNSSICISHTLYSHLLPPYKSMFYPQGKIQLKGAALPLEVYCYFNKE